MSLIENFAIARRHFISNRTNTIISLSGLVLGLGTVAVVLVLLTNELGYNRSFTDYERIYRVLNYNTNDNNFWANTPYILGESAKEQLSEVESYVLQYNINSVDIKVGSDFITINDILCTNEAFFETFGVPVLHGSSEDFDQAADKILINQETADKYFGRYDPVGKIVTIKLNGREYHMEVVGIFRNLPDNSTIRASIITGTEFGLDHLADNFISVGDHRNTKTDFKESWSRGLFFTNYLLLQNGADISNVELKLLELGKNHSSESDPLSFSLQPLKDIYFGSAGIVDNSGAEKGNISILYTIISAGLIILVVACINYLNLTSAQAWSRMKTFALRKVHGASKSDLIFQMVVESTLISIIAMPFAVLSTGFSLPLVSKLVGKPYNLNVSNELIAIISWMLIISLAAGIISGLFISFRATSFKLADSLKGKRSVGNNRYSMQKVLVIFQMIVFIILISSVTLIQKQVRFALTRDMGITKEGLLRVPLKEHNYELFKLEVSAYPSVLGVSGALWVPPHSGKMYISMPRVDQPDQAVQVTGDFADYHFVETMGMKLILGEDFKPQKHSAGVIINESAIGALGLTDVIGEMTAFGPVVGVVADFNMYTIREAIAPMIIGLEPAMCREMAIRINTADLNNTIDFLEETWISTGGQTSFEFEFTDDILSEFYVSDIRFSKTIGLMAFIAIFIASMGLFGLSLMMSIQKTKEIGIRKVNGAKVSEILLMLASDLIKWVSIAFVIAIPIAWYFMRNWLQNFAYKTELSWWIFILAGFLAMAIALITVSWQSWQAARRNPVEALRYE